MILGFVIKLELFCNISLQFTGQGKRIKTGVKLACNTVFIRFSASGFARCFLSVENGQEDGPSREQ